MAEFDLIEIIKRRCSLSHENVLLGIGDDAAVVRVLADHDLVICTDTMVAGVHFPLDTDPYDIGWKSLAVNLSDLAAMGAEPVWATLAMTLPDADAEFVTRFADGFAALAAEHEVDLIGGDTTRGPLTITVTAHGWVPSGCALRRAGANVGDAVFVTGTLGDAAAGLRCLKERDAESFSDQAKSQAASARLRSTSPLSRDENPIVESPLSSSRRTPESSAAPLFSESLDADKVTLLQTPSLERADLSRLPQKSENPNDSAMDDRQADDVLIERLNRPQPRVAAGLALRGLASACIDVSDGLLADLAHIATASGAGFEIGEGCLPASSVLFDRFDADNCRQFQLSGGDDYELAFTIAESRIDAMREAMSRAGCRVSRIGRVVTGPGVHVLDRNGERTNAETKGWEHFR